MKVDVEFLPFFVPESVIQKKPEGVVIAAGEHPRWPIAALDAETLSDQCDQFRAAVFRKAGKADPRAAEVTE